MIKIYRFGHSEKDENVQINLQNMRGLLEIQDWILCFGKTLNIYLVAACKIVISGLTGLSGGA